MTPYRTDGATTLLLSDQWRQLTDHLRDLIIIALEHSTKTRGNFYRIERCRYVCAENSEGKFSMLFGVQVKEAGQNEEETLQVTFTVSKNGELEWSLP